MWYFYIKKKESWPFSNAEEKQEKSQQIENLKRPEFVSESWYREHLLKGGFSTVNLLIEIDCFIKIFSISKAADLK